MQTTHHTNDSAANFAARIINGVRAFIIGDDTRTTALAAAYAAEIRSQRGLDTWVASLAAMSRRHRNALLLRTAATFRAEWATCGLSDALSRLADQPSLFHATLRALAPASFAQAA